MHHTVYMKQDVWFQFPDHLITKLIYNMANERVLAGYGLLYVRGITIIVSVRIVFPSICWSCHVR
jgi:hypothetical protein